MNFQQALEAAKNGSKISRDGWNGKLMWVAYTPGSEIEQENARSGAVLALSNELDKGNKIKINPHLDMKTADGSIICGWHATQTDMFAEDWDIVDGGICEPGEE